MADLNSLNIPEYEKWIEMKLPVVGQKHIKRKKDGKDFTILVVTRGDGKEISLFEWALKVDGGKLYCLQHHFNRQLEEANKE